MRQNGILMPVSALPSPYGIGCFSKEAYEFVDQLKEAGQTLWQILPLGPTSYGDSPYQSFSTFAGNPYYIDLNTLVEEGLLDKADCDGADFGGSEETIDYGRLYETRFQVLKKACSRAAGQGLTETEEYRAFLKTEEEWLSDYALFMAVKNRFGGRSWDHWDKDIRFRVPEALEQYREALKEDVGFFEFLQYEFYKQWNSLKAYANDKGIQIIGDIPVYVAFDSADTWAQPSLFQLDENRLPKAVAGCPPDGFSATGQLWGNPLYDWEYHRKTGYSWWVRRIRHCFRLYDVTRIDHFRGFDEYYSIPYKDEDAVNGCWRKGPGMELFHAVKKELGDLPIIAEDLGFLTDSVRELLRASGYPGMKVLQFAFDSREESDYLPHNYERNCVVYTGTHDNDTLRGWYEALAPEDKEMALTYLNDRGTDEREIHWDYICLAMRSVADTCIIPMQDILGLGREGRINTPSTLGGNWVWRMKEGAFTPVLAGKMRKLTEVYGRSVKIERGSIKGDSIKGDS